MPFRRSIELFFNCLVLVSVVSHLGMFYSLWNSCINIMTNSEQTQTFLHLRRNKLARSLVQKLCDEALGVVRTSRSTSLIL